MKPDWINKAAFIVGHPKSGTTLMAAMLDGHQNLIVLPTETDFFAVIHKNRKRIKRESDPRKRVDLIMHLMLRRTHLRQLRENAVDDFERGDYDYSSFDFARFETQLRRCLEDQPFTLETGFDSIVHAFADTERNTPHDENVRAWVEKTPGHEYHVDTLAQWYPQSKFIHIVRDPRDNWTSYKRKHPKLTVTEYGKNWRSSLEIGEKHADKYGSRYLILRYEDLVVKPEETLRIACRLLDIPFSESTLTPSKLGKPWRGNSMWGMRSRKVSKAPIGRYHSWPRQSDIRFIETTLYKAMMRYSYKIEDKPGRIQKARAFLMATAEGTLQPFLGFRTFLQKRGSRVLQRLLNQES